MNLTELTESIRFIKLLHTIFTVYIQPYEAYICLFSFWSILVNIELLSLFYNLRIISSIQRMKNIGVYESVVQELSVIVKIIVSMNSRCFIFRLLCFGIEFFIMKIYKTSPLILLLGSKYIILCMFVGFKLSDFKKYKITLE